MAVAGALSVAVLLGPASARALGLDVLEGGGTLDSGNGQLSFSDFSVVRSGSIAADLSLFEVEALSDGLAIHGPIDATGGQAGDLFVQFKVTSLQPLEQAALSIQGSASGDDALASVTESIGELGDAQLFAYTTSGGQKLSDTLAISSGKTLSVAKDIVVDGGASGEAHITRIEQHFGGAQAPEARTALLLGLALLGLGARRAQGRPRAVAHD